MIYDLKYIKYIILLCMISYLLYDTWYVYVVYRLLCAVCKLFPPSASPATSGCGEAEAGISHNSPFPISQFPVSVGCFSRQDRLRTTGSDDFLSPRERGVDVLDRAGGHGAHFHPNAHADVFVCAKGGRVLNFVVAVTKPQDQKDAADSDRCAA